VNGGPAQGVAVARDRIEAGCEEALLGCGRELGEDVRGSVGEGAPEALDGLEGPVRVDQDGGEDLVRLLQRLERGEAVIGQQLEWRGGGQVDVGLQVLPLPGEGGKGGEAQGRDKREGRDWGCFMVAAS
jgi:hypothetical protein